jgi:D-3-phosphoglycerate dehydrogenase
MSVQFYDIVPKLPIGNAVSKPTLQSAMSTADFVSLHVPATTETNNLIGATEIQWMKKGSYLLNASRGSVVDTSAVASALRSGYLNGAAFDVYPNEPEGKGDKFVNDLQGCSNTILTPHIGMFN